MTKISNNKTTSNKANNWHEINWLDVNIRVQDLQDRIVKATMENNMKQVYKLQNELVISFEGRALAIRKVATSAYPYVKITGLLS